MVSGLLPYDKLFSQVKIPLLIAIEWASDNNNGVIMTVQTRAKVSSEKSHNSLIVQEISVGNVSKPKTAVCSLYCRRPTVLMMYLMTVLDTGCKSKVYINLNYLMIQFLKLITW